MLENYFAICAPGLEPVTARELHHLGLLKAAALRPHQLAREVGGISFRGPLEALYRANLQLRTASRVVMRVGEFEATTFPDLRRLASYLPWEKYIGRGRAVTVRATCHRSRLYHSDAVAERVALAIADHLGHDLPTAPAANEDEAEAAKSQLVLVRLVDDQCVFSVDASGALLHQRGYRLATAKAPLRETLAAAMVLASEWDGRAPVLDPFCGSGTIAIEAALYAGRRAPGLAHIGATRKFALTQWPIFDEDIWEAARAEAQAQAIEIPSKIFASDRDAGAMEAARANAMRAGVAESIEFTQQAVSAITPREGLSPGWVISNPPYGVRTSANKDVRDVYARFGQVLRAHYGGWQVALLLAHASLQATLSLPFDEGRSHHWVNGGLKVKYARARVRRLED